VPYATRIREREPDAQSACGRTENRQRDAFVREYLENVSAKSRDGVGLPSHTEQLGGHAVTRFNIPLTIDGYVDADGPTVVVASPRRAHQRRPPKTRSPRWPASGEQPKEDAARQKRRAACPAESVVVQCGAHTP
jgi:hypothetical protein